MGATPEYQKVNSVYQRKNVFSYISTKVKVEKNVGNMNHKQSDTNTNECLGASKVIMFIDGGGKLEA